MATPQPTREFLEKLLDDLRGRAILSNDDTATAQVLDRKGNMRTIVAKTFLTKHNDGGRGFRIATRMTFDGRSKGRSAIIHQILNA